MRRNDDASTYRIARRAMEGRYAWLEAGILASSPGGAADQGPDWTAGEDPAGLAQEVGGKS